MPVDAGAGIGLGTWPEWVAAILTGLAFLIAAVSLALEVSRRRKAQARLVYSETRHVRTVIKGAKFPALADGATVRFDGRTFAAGGSAPLDVQDKEGRDLFIAAEDQVIYTVAVCNVSDELVSKVNVRIYLDNDVAATGVIGIVPPHSETVAEFLAPLRSRFMVIGTCHEVVFRDAAGRWWLREEAEPIERVHEDPASFVWDFAPQEDQISIRVRAGRLWRRLRGRRPIP
ncbi:hypothetical protein [Demequina muriae]|uniref:Uncharacterized protein n=1 Tax=Demequina muriae TaxID=3051664 RepID=A0ABT8GEP8_9MICO|nr:hypothetical protein [Demequina sp. EGI L300058]MDN4479909.1 hypothetical protein [Demequina sp. EGI L300058]